MTNITFPSFNVKHGKTFGGYYQKDKKGDWTVFYTSCLDHVNFWIGSYDVSETNTSNGGMKIPVASNDEVEKILNIVKQADKDDWDGLQLWHALFDNKGE